MDMLASEMGISKRTIYENFRDKDEILHGVMELMAGKQNELTTRVLRDSDNVIDAVFRILDIMTEHFRKMSPAFRLDMKKYHNDIVSRIRETGNVPSFMNNTDILLRGIREGYFRKDINVSVTNKCLEEMVRISNDDEKYNTGDHENEEIIRSFFINYLRGISTQKGLDLINQHERKRPADKGQKIIQK